MPDVWLLCQAHSQDAMRAESGLLYSLQVGRRNGRRGQAQECTDATKEGEEEMKIPKNKEQLVWSVGEYRVHTVFMFFCGWVVNGLLWRLFG